LCVLYVSYDGALEPLGAAQVLPYIEGLAARSLTIDLISFEKPPDIADHSRRESLVERLRTAGVGWRMLRYHGRPRLPATALDIVAGAREIARAARSHDGQTLVHARGYVAALMGLMARRICDAKLLFDTRSFMIDERVDCGMWSNRSMLVRAARAVERRLLSTADAVTVVSRAGAQSLPSPAACAAAGRLRVIPPCVDLSRFRTVANPEAAKRTLDLSPGPVVVHSGALSTWYLADYTFRVGVEFARKSAGTFLVLTRELELAKALDTRHNARAVIRYADYDTMPRWLAACDAGLAIVRPGAAKRGSMPVKLGEYLACGLAAAATATVGDVALHLSGSTVGLAFDPDAEAPQDIAARLLEAAANPRRASIARSLAERLYALELGIREYADLYEDLGSSPLGGSRP
jgi:glycosyltransferase involved in cell wall biosynthesis